MRSRKSRVEERTRRGLLEGRPDHLAPLRGKSPSPELSSGTGTAAHITASTGVITILPTQLELAGPTPPTAMRDFWRYAAGGWSGPLASASEWSRWVMERVAFATGPMPGKLSGSCSCGTHRTLCAPDGMYPTGALLFGRSSPDGLIAATRNPCSADSGSAPSSKEI
ncbi:hypothetical protein Pmi06nite_35030 [Planotetraspora mira]|uniref:Uncharacterized protein n=1 Tax=Planotetraspora mira TaxID=58121 RepID=A0A8J3TQ98_9ACTN|nr:hypothetical protein Pmi06nite_35030 [Planotetraspora mira]